ncbi:MAG: hypothetical protein JSV56_02515 [Methanomassiliicoccales archaeon]|nr:MAG: hypothetical protein JSV56_02515 [Methanomassiliicoccales archaeon]
MFELLTSKLAMMIAVMIILSSILAIFTLQREDAKDMELRNTADKVSGAVDDLNSLLGETKVNVTFDSEKEGFYVDPVVLGKNYEITITRYEVVITQDGRKFISDFIVPIHLWRPDSNTYNLTQIEDSDAENMRLEFVSGEDFIMERALLDIEGEYEYKTFVYL